MTHSEKYSVPQQGIEPWPFTIWVSIIPLDYQDTWSLSDSPLQGESMSSCISSSEITLTTKCDIGSNKWHYLNKFCASMVDRALASHYPGEHHTTILSTSKHFSRMPTSCLRPHMLQNEHVWTVRSEFNQINKPGRRPGPCKEKGSWSGHYTRGGRERLGYRTQGYRGADQWRIQNFREVGASQWIEWCTDTTENITFPQLRKGREVRAWSMDLR